MRRRSGCTVIALTLALAGLLGSGCVVLDEPPRFGDDAALADLGDAARAFGENLRWGRLDLVAPLVHPDDRAAFKAVANGLDRRLRFTAFEVDALELGPGENEGRVTAMFELYRFATAEETTLVEVQRWERVNGRWFVRPEFENYVYGERGVSSRR